MILAPDMLDSQSRPQSPGW